MVYLPVNHRNVAVCEELKMQESDMNIFKLLQVSFLASPAVVCLHLFVVRRGSQTG